MLMCLHCLFAPPNYKSILQGSDKRSKFVIRGKFVRGSFLLEASLLLTLARGSFLLEVSLLCAGISGNIGTLAYAVIHVHRL